MIFNEINKFDDMAHEALMGIWWTGVLLKQQSRHFFRNHEITEAQFNAMMVLKYAEQLLSQQELSERLLTDKSNVTALVDSMEKMNLVRRRKERADRRIYRIKLTDKGLEVLGNIENSYREQIHDIMSVFSPGEMKSLTEKMVRLQQKIGERQ